MTRWVYGASKGDGREEYMVDLEVEGVMMAFRLDPGANVTVVNSGTAGRLKLKKMAVVRN